ncbi:MAG: twin-arginine translocase subunit TatB [Alphaproteobacteria bacterium]|nr:twin-arginine translocase subunit TatB [Alphaproteobacteria bacterium]
MFDIGWSELLVIVVVALIFIGPRDLPATIRTVSAFIRKIRRMAWDFQSSLEDMARETGVTEVKRDLQRMTDIDPGRETEKALGLDYGDAWDPTNGNPIRSPGADAAASPAATAAATMSPSPAGPESAAAEPGEAGKSRP